MPSSLPPGPPSPGSAGLNSKTQRGHKLTVAERHAYIRSLGILQQGENACLRFLDDAVAHAPLPAPWKLHRDQRGRVYFANKVTGQSSWGHPLESSLRELAGVCRTCFAFDRGQRETTTSKLKMQWEENAKRDLSKWYAVKHDSGKDYYCHRDTGETTWLHPAEVVMPEHYIKIQAVEKLGDDSYFASLQSTPGDRYSVTPLASPHSTGGFTNFNRASGGSEGGMGVTQTSQFTQNSTHSSTKEAAPMWTQPQQGSKKVAAVRLLEERIGELERDLNEERRKAVQAQQERSDLLVSLARTNKEGASDELAKGLLEIRLIAYTQDHQRKEALFASQRRENHPALEEAYQREADLARHRLQSERTAAHRQASSVLAPEIPATAITPASARAATPTSRQSPSSTQAGTIDKVATAHWKELEDRLFEARKNEDCLRAELLAAREELNHNKMSQQTHEQDSKGDCDELKRQLRDALAGQSALRERLTDTEEKLRGNLDAYGRAAKAEAQLVETRKKFDHVFLCMQAAEYAKGMAEAKLAETHAPSSLQCELEAQLLTAGAELTDAKDRAAAAEARLGKERAQFERIRECVKGAEMSKEALESRLVVIEKSFLDGLDIPVN